MAGFRTLLVDNHELFRAALRALLAQNCEVAEFVGEATDGREAVRLAIQLQPDLVFMDLNMPGLNGVEATRQIIKALPSTRVIVLSMYTESQYVEEALKAGAMAYVSKESPSSDLIAAVNAVAQHKTFISPLVAGQLVHNILHRPAGAITRGKQGKSELTAREREVLQLLAEGKTSKEIGTQLGIQLKTVEAHRSQIMIKLEIHSIAGLTKYAIRQGITSL